MKTRAEAEEQGAETAQMNLIRECRRLLAVRIPDDDGKACAWQVYAEGADYDLRVLWANEAGDDALPCQRLNDMNMPGSYFAGRPSDIERTMRLVKPGVEVLFLAGFAAGAADEEEERGEY